MARKPRIDFPGAVFHVIVRGNRRATIFHEEADYLAYLDRLERYRRRDGVTVHAYVLMTNHVHLLVETGSPPLSRTMQALQFTYSQYYNRRYDKSGHVFQGRYQAILCDREAYLLELVRYLHLNPARMRTPLSPWTYRWSSHATYVGRPSSVQVDTAAVLGSFHRQLGPARQAYRRFLQEGLAQGHQTRFYDTVDQRFLGDEGFIEEADRKTAATREVTVRPPRVAFGPLLTAVATTFGVTPKEILAPGRQRALVPARALFVHLARAWSGLTTRELGRRLQRDPSMISRLAAGYLVHPEPATEARVQQSLASRAPK
ncbi:MAG: Chromosomal replication initiator protein DnaA [Nitrospira sp.]|nr:Chromosomal replication initiator protein DnaA [Nitrospira sp.]